jgi:hypothetical protein
MQRILAVAMLAVLMCCGQQAMAQLEMGATHSGASSAAYYYISKPGEITMSINLWGFVRNPGRYEVPISTDLVQLLSYAGGPLADADLGSVRIARVVRGVDAIRTVEFTVNLNHLDRLDDKARKMEPGDTIFIERTALSVADFFNIITTTAVVTAAIANVLIAVHQLK